MRRWRYVPALLIGLAVSLPVLAADESVVDSVPLDPVHSRIGFEIRTRYGQRLEGHFPRFEGRRETLADGRQRVVVQLDASHVEIPGHPRYTRLVRAAEFFDVATHPRIDFQSLPHSPDTARTGATVDGWLTLRGIRGPVRMQVAAAGCPRPGYDCAVTGKGEISRSAHGMDRWQLAVGDRVTFVLQVRLAGADPQ